MAANGEMSGPIMGIVSCHVSAYRLGEFLKTDTDVEIVGRSDLEDQTLDFSEVEQLMEHIHSIPGVCLTGVSAHQHHSGCVSPSLSGLAAEQPVVTQPYLPIHESGWLVLPHIWPCSPQL